MFMTLERLTDVRGLTSAPSLSFSLIDHVDRHDRDHVGRRKAGFEQFINGMVNCLHVLPRQPAGRGPASALSFGSGPGALRLSRRASYTATFRPDMAFDGRSMICLRSR